MSHVHILFQEVISVVDIPFICAFGVVKAIIQNVGSSNDTLYIETESTLLT